MQVIACLPSAHHHAQETERLISQHHELVQVIAGDENGVFWANLEEFIFQLHPGTPVHDDHTMLVRVKLFVAVFAGFQVEIADMEVVGSLFRSYRDLLGNAVKFFTVAFYIHTFPGVIVDLPLNRLMMLMVLSLLVIKKL